MVRRSWTRDPFQPWREEVERFFSTHFPAAGEMVRGPGDPAINLWEDQGELYAEAELPGVKQDDLEVLVVGGELTIKGQRPAPANGAQAFHRRERNGGPFQRTVRLPVDVDASKVEATLRDGVLTIKLPTAEAAKPRKIPVQAGN
ncbi:MAG: Hsp20/alpha crystallin family protein [Planctomycetaceae bacterium]|nr:Hsp20/alpha crystallin family protein [Planctomycetaceae bacterium]